MNARASIPLLPLTAPDVTQASWRRCRGGGKRPSLRHQTYSGSPTLTREPTPMAGRNGVLLTQRGVDHADRPASVPRLKFYRQREGDTLQAAWDARESRGDISVAPRYRRRGPYGAPAAMERGRLRCLFTGRRRRNRPLTVSFR